MSWECKLFNFTNIKHVEYENPINGVIGKTFLTNENNERFDFYNLPIGAMFYVPLNIDYHEWPWMYAKPERLSDFYIQNNSYRRPLIIKLPSNNGLGNIKGDIFCIDGKEWKSSNYYGGWTVSGEPPFITMSPSINIVGSYHGFLQNGILSDDCEGRKF